MASSNPSWYRVLATDAAETGEGDVEAPTAAMNELAVEESKELVPVVPSLPLGQRRKYNKMVVRAQFKPLYVEDQQPLPQWVEHGNAGYSVENCHTHQLSHFYANQELKKNPQDIRSLQHMCVSLLRTHQFDKVAKILSTPFSF